jgi:HEPN domain-containing protein
MDDAIAQLTREWLTKASHDLQNARIVSGVVDAPLDTAIYHCQQAAEKSVKGWLTANYAAFEKTHDLRRLMKLAAGVLPGFSQFTEAAEVLTPYVSAFRYPGITADPMPTRAEFEAALQHAQAIYDFVLNLLPKEAKP